MTGHAGLKSSQEYLAGYGETVVQSFIAHKDEDLDQGWEPLEELDWDAWRAARQQQPLWDMAQLEDVAAMLKILLSEPMRRF